MSTAYMMKHMTRKMDGRIWVIKLSHGCHFQNRIRENDMDNMCTDNRFELIEKYKKELIESTNIETSQDEMAVLDNLLFRFWQMGWLDRLEQHRYVQTGSR